MLRRPSILLLVLLATPGAGLAQGRYQASVRIGQVDSVFSATLDEVRPYLVYTPPSYDAESAATQRFPVLYLLDGDAHFHSVSGLIQILGTGVNGTWAIPEMIVVAIPNTDRTRDLTPTHAAVGPDGEPAPGLGMESSGGNPAFFTFLQDELIPRIEVDYRTMPYRVFVGHSLGGITALNALYEIPDVFDAYVAIDPSLWWDREVLLRRAKDFFSTADLGGKALYVAQANTVSPDDTTANPHFSAITRFDAVMRAYDESGIRYGFRYYSEDDHGSVPLIAEYDALRFIFDGYRVPLQRVMADPPLLTAHYRAASERLGAPFQPPARLVLQLASFSMAQDTAAALAFVDIGQDLYPGDHNWPELRGDVAAARGETEAARRWYEEAAAKTEEPGHVREKIAHLGGEGR